MILLSMTPVLVTIEKRERERESTLLVLYCRKLTRIRIVHYSKTIGLELHLIQELNRSHFHVYVQQRQREALQILHEIIKLFQPLWIFRVLHV